MSYLLDKKNRQKKLRNIILSIVVLSIIIYFNNPIFNNLSYLANKIFKPVLVVGNNIGSNLEDTSYLLKSKKSIFLENESLKKELNEMSAQIYNFNTLEEENNKLKEILARKSGDSELVLSAILSKPNRSLFDTLIIDVGEKDGIEVGNTVFALGYIPIGKVAEVFPDSSKVVLFSTSGEKTEIVITGGDVFMEIVGRGGGNFEMILPRDFEILKGATVSLPGLDSSVIAKVETIISDPRDSYQKALLTSPVNIQNLRFVQVDK